MTLMVEGGISLQTVEMLRGGLTHWTPQLADAWRLDGGAVRLCFEGEAWVRRDRLP